MAARGGRPREEETKRPVMAPPDWRVHRMAFGKRAGGKDRSVIVYDPNGWSDDPRYIVDLLKRIVRVSMETVEIVRSLPSLQERT